ncbi:MAG: terminase small subunit [Pseudomonadota bacterium]|nr:terminase small subunit [Pseudomonadota bacterium]
MTDKKKGKKPGLNIKQAKFIERLAEHGVQVRAAVEAGYSPKSANQQASELLHNYPKVKEAIEGITKKVFDKAEYNVEKARAELYAHIAGAIADKQWSAVSKLQDSLIRLAGLYQDKLTLERHEVVDVHMAIFEARNRVAGDLGTQLGPDFKRWLSVDELEKLAEPKKEIEEKEIEAKKEDPDIFK